MILVDTHVVIWLAFERGKLSKKATAAISDARKSNGGVAVSDISLWEIAVAVRRGRIQLEITLDSFLEEIEERFTVLPIGAHASYLGTALSNTFPNDPADRIIAGTALARGLPLITADGAIRKSGVLTTIW